MTLQRCSRPLTAGPSPKCLLSNTQGQTPGALCVCPSVCLSVCLSFISLFLSLMLIAGIFSVSVSCVEVYGGGLVMCSTFLGLYTVRAWSCFFNCMAHIICLYMAPHLVYNQGSADEHFMEIHTLQ